MTVALKRERLHFEYHPLFLSHEEADELYSILKSKCFPKSSNRRSNVTYGDEGVSYTVQFKNNTIVRVAIPWSEFPLLLKYKHRLEQLTGMRFNYVVIQRYPSGKIGIAPHRDKEMKSGTVIAGISLYTPRIIALHPPRYNRIDREIVRGLLQNGSLYLLYPPTNDHWSHEIEVDDSITGERISLTFRYVETSEQQ